MLVKQVKIEQIFSLETMLDLFSKYSKESKVSAAPEHAPNLINYKQLEDNGSLTSLGLFDNDILVGFCVIVYHRLSHSDKIMAYIDSFFVEENYRKFGSGKRLIHEAEEIAKKIGVSVITMTAPKGSRLAKSAHLFGYEETNIIFSKDLSNE